MCIDNVEFQPSNLTVAAAIAREQQSRSRFTHSLRINGIVQHQVATMGFNLYEGHVEWFSPFSETWIAHEIPSFVHYMQSAEQIVTYLVDYLNLQEEYAVAFP